MASVLFVVTIPTEPEEERLKSEFFAKKFDSKIEQIDNTQTTGGANSFPLKVDSSRTTTSTSNTTPVTTTLYKNNSNNNNNNDGQSINDNNAETVSTTTLDASSITASNSGAEATGVLGTIQYSTFPKRRKSSQKTNPLEEQLADVLRNQDYVGTSSLKDMDINNTVSKV